MHYRVVLIYPGGQAGKMLNILAGVVPIAPGLQPLAAGLKEGDRFLQTRSIVKVP